MKDPKSVSRLIIWFDIALVIFATVLGIAKTGNPSRYFGEGRFTMGVSCLQLLSVAGLALGTYKVRRQTTNRRFFSLPIVWLLVGIGFVYLAFDDAFQIHEHLDNAIRKHFHLANTPLVDRIDDALIGIYGLIGLAVMWFCRREVLLFRKEMLRPLIIGFAVMFLSVICDTISNGNAFLFSVTGNLSSAKWLDVWFSVGDGAFTILAEGLFVIAFYAAFHRAKMKTPDGILESARGLTRVACQ